MDPTLADAFDDDDDSDDEADDRQRLVRQNSTPLSGSTEIAASSPPPAQVTAAQHTAPSGSRPRVMGGGVGTDGVFANLSAKPERTTTEKEEQPPVSGIRS